MTGLSTILIVVGLFLVGIFEKPLPLPNSIADSVLANSKSAAAAAPQAKG